MIGGIIGGLILGGILSLFGFQGVLTEIHPIFGTSYYFAFGVIGFFYALLTN